MRGNFLTISTAFVILNFNRVGVDRFFFYDKMIKRLRQSVYLSSKCSKTIKVETDNG